MKTYSHLIVLALQRMQRGKSFLLVIPALLLGSGMTVSVTAESGSQNPIALELRGDSVAREGSHDLDTEGVDMSLSIDGRVEMKISLDYPLLGNEPAEGTYVLEEVKEHIDREEWGDAIAKLRPIAKVDPNDVPTRMMAVAMLSEMNREAEALKILESLVQLRPNDYRVLNNAAWFYAASKDKSLRDGAKAIELANKAILLESNSCHVWSTLAESYFIIGEFEKARKAARKAFALGGQQNAGHKNMNEYSMQVWRSDQAVTAFSLQR